ncbi:MAG TPA: hypothetical protein VGB70_09690 [Allosphingosinicella sp.]|jgi:hypothetical protein
MNVFEFILGIILITTVATLFKMLLTHQRHKLASSGGEENGRLRHEVQTLSERLAVLERIAVEKENSLDRQIEALRDR